MSIPQSGASVIERPEQLTEYLEGGCKPKQDWRIGTEHEKFGFRRSDRSPLPYDGPCSIKAVLEGLCREFGWDTVEESGNIVGLSKGRANVSLEPGGQLELSGAPLETLHETCDEVNDHLREVRSVADKIGAAFVGIGATPDWPLGQMPMMPKGRYKLMTQYMKRVGSLGLDMMYRTCTIQANLDFGSERDMAQKLRTALALQPVATALFANSPFIDGRPAGQMSWRGRVWRDVDPDRTGMLPFVFEEGFGFEAWTDYALGVPMYFVYRDGNYVDALGQSFRDFLAGRLPALPGELPRVSDWADHLTTIFPEARIKRFIEVRGADGGPWRRLCALPAYWVGILYEQDSLDAAWDLVKGFSAEEREGLRVAAAEHGLKGRFAGISLQELAERSLELAEAGLRRRGRAGSGGLVPDEAHFLNDLKSIVESGRSPAEELLAKTATEWNGDLGRIYDEYCY